jgi:periplasmic divalent cation tolerance protein
MYKALISRPAEKVQAQTDVTSTKRPPVVVVLTTLSADADAAQLARTLVEERLAACVNVLPAMRSIYRWKGAIEEDGEQQLVIKTAPDRLATLEARLRQLHPYELPEFVVLDARASEAYAGWVGESSRPEQES